MSSPSLWTSTFWALIIHILIGSGVLLYTGRSFRIQVPEVYRVTIVTAPPTVAPSNKKETMQGSADTEKDNRRTSLKKGITMLNRIKKIKKERRKRLLESKKNYKEERALEEALKRIHTEKIAQIERRVKLKKSVLSTIKALPSKTEVPVSREMERYSQEVEELIKVEWVFPGALAQRPYSVEVSFRVKPNGEVIGISVIRSSGSSLFDASVIKAIKKASPLPPPPPGGEEITIRFRTEGSKNEG